MQVDDDDIATPRRAARALMAGRASGQDIYDAAIRSDSAELMTYVMNLDDDDEYDFDWPCVPAAMHGSLGILKAWEGTWDRDSDLSCAAAAHGQLDVLKWMRASGHGHWEKDNRVSNAAIATGHEDTYAWLLKNGSPPAAPAAVSGEMRIIL
jgi:hypothetical protein